MQRKEKDYFGKKTYDWILVMSVLVFTAYSTFYPTDRQNMANSMPPPATPAPQIPTENSFLPNPIGFNTIY